MNMDMSLDLSLRTQLRMTPQLQQAILFLQLPIAELLEKIQELANQNPLIDVNLPEVACLQNNTTETTETEILPGSNDELLSYASPDLKTVPISLSDEQFNFENLLDHYTVDTTLREQLIWQMQFEHFNELDEQIAIAIIDALDENGFLTTPLAELQAGLNSKEITVKNIEKILATIQQFEPSGIAARDLKECLLIQLKELPPEYPLLKETILLIEKHLDLLAKHDYRELKEKLKIDDEILLKIVRIIKSLNPVPGQIIHQEKMIYEIPDVMIKKIHDQWIVFLNDDLIPKIKINQQYTELLRHNMEKNADYLKTNLQEAQWLIKSLDKRHKTLLSVAQYIVDQQNDFLNSGAEKLKPLTIKDVAEALNIHESTVSRITSHKYILTPQGLFELKYFFSSQVSANSNSNGMSSIAVKALIKQMIHQENPESPLSDSQIAAKLKSNGILVARRTVAKYRESLNIAAVDQRKFLK